MNEEKFKGRKLIGNKGITLVALIITIVVLLILAMAAIGAIRDSKIITHAQNAGSSYTIAQEKEQIGVAVGEWKIQKATPGNTKTFKEVIGDALQGQIKPIVENTDGSLTVTFTKTGNAYIVDGNGNITKQEDEIIGGAGEPVTNDFEIAVEQTQNGSPVNSVTLTIRPTIPDTWKKTEFTEEEAVKIVNESTLNVPNVTSIEDYDIALYNYFNDYSETALYGENDVEDFEALKTAISSKITLGEDPENEIFSYLMSLAGLNYSTVYAAATDMYRYEPTTYSVKIRKSGGEWIDITNNWRYTSYEVTENGTYEIQMQLDDKKSTESVQVKISTYYLGRYVRYDVDGDGIIETEDKYESILWRVLRDDDNKVELIAADALGNVDLTSTDFNDARNKYNNAVDLMVTECKRVTGIESNIRNVGGPNKEEALSDTNTVDFEELTKTTDFTPTVDISIFSQYEGATNGLRKGDNNYEEDWNQMENVGIAKADNSKGYWIASRKMFAGSISVDFNVRCVYEQESYDASYYLFNVWDNANTQRESGSNSLAVRPVLTLKPGVLDNTTQSGTEDDPIEIYQNK